MKTTLGLILIVAARIALMFEISGCGTVSPADPLPTPTALIQSPVSHAQPQSVVPPPFEGDAPTIGPAQFPSVALISPHAQPLVVIPPPKPKIFRLSCDYMFSELVAATEWYESTNLTIWTLAATMTEGFDSCLVTNPANQPQGYFRAEEILKP